MQMTPSKFSCGKVHCLYEMFSSWGLERPQDWTGVSSSLSTSLLAAPRMTQCPPPPWVVDVMHGQSREENSDTLNMCLVYSRRAWQTLTRTELKFGYRAKVSEKLSSWRTPCPFPAQWVTERLFPSVLSSLFWLLRTWALWPFSPVSCQGLTRVLLLICIRNSIKALTSRNEISKRVFWKLEGGSPNVVLGYNISGGGWWSGVSSLTQLAASLELWWLTITDILIWLWDLGVPAPGFT